MRFLFWRRKLRQQQLEQELQTHLQMAASDRVDRGESAERAQQAARQEFGNVELVQQVTRDQWGWRWLEELLQDLRYGSRMLRKNPGFTLVAVLTLALGIGANTAIFSIVNGVLLQPLPYPHPEQLVVVARTAPRFDHPVPVSGPNFLDWRARATQFQSLAGFDGRGFTIMLGNQPEHILGAAVSFNFLSVLQVRPVLGRDFSAAEEHTGNDHVALLSHAFWKGRLGSDTGWVGRSLILNGQTFSVIGVLPAGFRYVLMEDAQVFIPLNLDNASRGENFMSVIGRVKPGVPLRQAQSQMDIVARALEREYPTDNAEQGAIVIPMLSRVGARIREALFIMLAVVGLVLLIACANIGNLTLAQAARRRSEIAVRSALGAGTYRLIRQCLTESVLLGLLGAALGVFLGYCGLQAFRILGPDNVPRLEEVQINMRVLLFSFGISIFASVLFGLIPALHMSRVNLADTLKEGSMRATSGSAGGLLRQGLVVTEIAFSLVLLAGAGLAVRSFLKLTSTETGYDSRNLLTFYLSPQIRKAVQAESFYLEVLERISAIPGVVSVAMSRSIPPAGGEVDGPVITSEHSDIDPNRAPDIIFNPINPGYFRTMRLPLLAGREFSGADVPGAPPAVVLNEAAASSLFPNENALGQRVKLGVDDLKSWWTVIGVVADERYFGWDSDRTPTAYLPVLQVLKDGWPDYDSAIIIRTCTEPLSFLPAVRSTMASIDRQMALLGPESMEQRLGHTFAPHRFNMALLAAFAGLALLLAAVGIYGVMAQFVTQRTHEIGIRVALGAHRSNVLRLILGQGMRLALLGLGIGVVVAVGATHLIRSLLYGISASDPASFFFVAALLIGVVLLACYIPARRAMRVDPVVALRHQ
jgi:putative ABC transport system permease protein